MTAPNPMTRKEMLELAALDVLGLLDEYEAALYTRSFHQAPASVQDEIVQLQAEIAEDPALLSDENPDATLRDRVLDYVSRAMEQELAPIATIGHRRQEPVEQRDVIARIGFAGSGLGWRVATFALCGVVLVFIYFLSVSIQQQHELTKLALDNNTSTQIEQILGRTFKDYFFDDTTHRFNLKPSASSDSARAVLLVAEDFGRAMLITEELPEGTGPMELTVRDANGTVHVVARFEGRRRLASIEVNVAQFASLGTEAVWEVRGANDFLLRSV
ncbi:MAG TPA: hypothetical protein PK400_11325 [Phycisphaerales bacterium]|nr:hypothetical protein [Phycisphaerales bacterium]HRQ74293.1 hypothetical protein [Phycisphaerales bacterium]